MEFIKTNTFLFILIVINLLLIILYIFNNIKLSKMISKNKSFMTKLGKGENVQEVLKEYIFKVEEVEMLSNDIIKRNERIEDNLGKCMQKVGLVRYTAFDNIGSDLSFALAILNKENDGVVLNGIYQSEGSNIFSKPVVKGKSPYKLSEEEEKAINIAINS